MYLKFSKYMDEVKKIEEKAELNNKKKEANHILRLYVDLQQVAPTSVIEKLTWEKVKELYKKYNYNFVRTMLTKELAKYPKPNYELVK